MKVVEQLLFLPLLTALACEHSSVTEPPSQEVSEDPFDCAAGDSLDQVLVTDFESGVALGFYTNADGTEGATVEPPAGSSSPVSQAMSPGRCGTSQYAFQMRGDGLESWGLVFGKNFDNAPADYSQYEGVSFWARRGKISGQSVFFSVTDANTDPIEGRCATDSNDLSEKCDAYGTGIGLSEEWRFFQVPFSSLRQRGFGVITEAFEPQALVGISWAAEGPTWDIWVDDVAFYSTSSVPGEGGTSGL